MTPHRRSTLAAVVLVVAYLSIAASCPPAGMDDEARAVFYANEVADRIGAVQSTAIALNVTGEMPDATAVLIVRFTVSSMEVLRDVPEGWAATVLTASQELQRQLNPAEYSAVWTVLTSLDALLGAGGDG